MLFTFQGTGKN